MIDLTQERDIETLRQISLLLDREVQRALYTAIARRRAINCPEDLLERV